MSQNRQEQTKRKAPRTAWRPGRSGNPGGRPRIVKEIRELARQHGAAAIERLRDLMHSSNGGVAVRAASELLDRGYGRPSQSVEPPQEEIAPRIIFFQNDRNRTGFPQPDGDCTNHGDSN